MEFYFFTDAGDQISKQRDGTLRHSLPIERFVVPDLSFFKTRIIVALANVAVWK